jgi:hypothetical protein
MASLQNKQGGVGRAMTAEESDYRFWQVRDAAQASFKNNPAKWGWQVRFSWDGLRAHESAEPDLQLSDDQLVKPPPKSPDLQRAVEDPHSMIHRQFKKRLAADRQVRSVTDAVKLLKNVVEDVVTRKYVRNLISGLPETYRSVIERGGDWAGQGRR